MVTTVYVHAQQIVYIMTLGHYKAHQSLPIPHLALQRIQVRCNNILHVCTYILASFTALKENGGLLLVACALCGNAHCTKSSV